MIMVRPTRFILSEIIPEATLEKAKHRLVAKVIVPAIVYEKLNSSRIRGSSGAIVAGKTWVKA